MKRPTLITFIALVIAIYAYPLNRKDLETFRKVNAVCLEKTQVNESYVLATIDAVFEDDPKLKEFLFCSNKVKQIQDENGNILKNDLKRTMGNPFWSDEKIEAIRRKCSEKKESGPETAFHFWKCACHTIVYWGVDN